MLIYPPNLLTPVKILVVGATHIDYTLTVEKLPKIGETVIGDNIRISLGGKGANQAVAASRLGAETYLISRVGDDMMGKTALAELKRNNVRTEYVIVDKNAKTGTAFIFVDRSGKNMIGVSPGADANVRPEDVERAFNSLNNINILLTQLEIPLRTVEYSIHKARERNVKIILNPAPARELSDELLKNVDIITPNEIELSMLSGVDIVTTDDYIKASKHLIDRGVKNVIVTRGEKGAMLVTRHESFYVEGIRVNAIDTTGAGDAFNATLAVMLAIGKSLREAIRYANVAGALATTKVGAQEALPTMEELTSFHSRLKERG